MCALFSRRKPAPSADDLVHASVPELHDAEIAAVYYCQRQGGDFFEFMRVRPDRVLFGLLDVAGTAQDSRDVVSATRQTFRSAGARLFSSEAINEADAMAELCHELNRTIISTAHGVRSCPAFIGSYDETLGIMCYLNAGHTPGLVRDKVDVTELGATALPLGLFSHVTCDAPMVALEPSAALLLVSRGVVEGRHKREEFGLARVKEGMKEGKAKTAKELCVCVLDGVWKFMGAAPTHNDVTSLALLRNGNTQQAS